MTAICLVKIPIPKVILHKPRWSRNKKKFATRLSSRYLVLCKIKMHIWTQNLLWLFKPRMNSWPVQKRLTPLGHGGHPNVNMSHLEVTHAFQQLLHMINQENGKQSFLAVRKWWKSQTPKLLAFSVKDPNWSIKPYRFLRISMDFLRFPVFLHLRMA